MKRKDLTALLTFAGYHADSSAFTRLLVENRISIAAAREHYSAGASARRAGVRCGCSECAPGAST